MASLSAIANPEAAQTPNCLGCLKPIDEGSVVAFGDALFHFECFICAKCGMNADHTSKLLLLADGRPVCEGCSYICASCRQTIGDEAIMTDDEAYHAECFRCVSCKKRIDDLVFTQTSKGIYCKPCHERRRANKQMRRDEKEKRQQLSTKSLPLTPSSSHTGQDDRSQRHTSRLLDPQLVSDYVQIQEALTRSEATTPPPHENNLPTPARSRNVSAENLPSSSDSLSSVSTPTQTSTQTASATQASVKTLEKSSQVELALPDIPSLNLSFFDNDSSDLLNLTKSLGSNLLSSKNDSTNRDWQDGDKSALSVTSPPKSKASSATDILASLTALDNFPLPPKGNTLSDVGQLPLSSFDLDSDTVPQDKASIEKLKQELKASNTKLIQVSENLHKMKEASKRALDEFQHAKEEFEKEASLRQQCEYTIKQLQHQLTLLHQAKAKNADQFAAVSNSEIERVANIRVELEKTCKQLKEYRHKLSKDIDDMVQRMQAGLAGPISHLYQQQQNALMVEIKSLQMERDALQAETRNLSRTRDEVIDEMVVLNTQIADLTSMNNDLSRRVTEREREAAAVMASTSFLYPTSTRSTELSPPPPVPMQRKSSEASMVFGHVASRDSFNGTQAPTVFKIKKKNTVFPKFGVKSSKTEQSLLDDNRSIYSLKSSSMSTQSLAFFGRETRHSPQQANQTPGSHSFQVTSFLRPTKCGTCGEKMWGLSEYRCQGCGLAAHSHCLSRVPQMCHASTASSLDLLGTSAKNDSRSVSLFGTDLVAQVYREGRQIPLIVQKCIEAVEARGMDFEGIYRRSGGAAQMRMIQIAFEKGQDIDLTDEDEVNDICSVTSVLKYYFRQLPNPLLTFELYSGFIDAVSISDESEKLYKFKELLSQLPSANYATLKLLVEHLYRVSEHSDENRMSIKNLAMVFGPTLMQDKESSRDFLDMSYKNATIEYIVKHSSALF